ncbi:MAG: MBL fold metallo-hydrolase, partial [Thermodesulfobacteriota bacterium]
FFGLPQLLLHLYERRRTEPLHIVGGIPLESEVSKAMELAYPGLLAKFPFQLIFTRIPAGRSVELLDLEIRVAANTHSIESFGVLIKSGSRSVYYSGDGKSRNAGIDLMTGADLVIHESFSIRDRFANHGSVNTCLEIFRQTGCRKMALVHLCRESRAQEQDIEHLIRNAGNDIFLPRDQETIILD